MSSLIQGYEYDIFISYRHNDNRSGWVTEFVNAVEEELATTIKEPLSIYFDKNPYDGLLETHNVDKSLEGKLRCLIFIPIISQTYCDPKSFAWQHEFLAFIKLVKGDQFGHDIKLSNGNVASRILPIKIHDIDSEDKSIIENELGYALRPIEFIYKEAGVNRPLRSNEENPIKNQNQTVYRNQVNKVANAVKEIITAIKNPVTTSTRTTTNYLGTIKPIRNKKVLISSFSLLLLITISYFFYQQRSTHNEQQIQLDKSIAVLPFADMSPNKDQEYLGDGIAEEIINALVKVNELKVIGRTSSFQFKGEKVDLREVGAKLQVATVLEGSVRKSGKKIRITAQLIKVEDGTHIWSEQYDRELKDVFVIQDEIATKISQKLALSLNINIRHFIIPTTNMEAYEMTLKGNLFIRQGPTGVEKAREYYQKAVALDSNYSEAQIGYAATHIFTGSPDEMIQSIEKIKKLNPDPVILTELMLTYFMWREGNWDKCKELYENSVSAGYPLGITHAYYEAAIGKNMNKAIRTLEKVVERDPLFLDGLRNLVMFYLNSGEFDKAHKNIDKMIEINSGYVDSYLLRAQTHLQEKKL
jgi:TolB-like protein